MRKFLFAILFFVSTFFAKAQSCDLELEGFENGGGFPSGWTVNGAYTNGTTAPNTGTYHAGFNTDTDELISDTYACPSQLCFYWRTSGSTSDFFMDVSWSDNGGSTWNLLNTIDVQDTTNRTTYRQNCIDLSAITFSNPSNVSFRFYQYNRVAGTWYLDDVCISSGGATQLQFSSAPNGCTPTNTNFSVEICAVDACGNVDASFNGNITVAKNSGSGTLSGTTTLAASNGCATFTNLQFDAADFYTLSASASGFSNITSSSFEVKIACPLVDTLVVMSYNLLNFPNGRDDCGTNITITNRVDTLKKIIQYVKPDILMVCELQDQAGADLILNNALNVDGITYYQRATFVPNQSTSFTELNNLFFYNSTKVTLKRQDEILTGTRDVGEYIVYGKDPNLSTTNDTTFIDFYTTHLKAGNTSTDISDRASECNDVRTHIDAKPSGRNNVIGGDFNFYDAAEAGYQTLCYSGTYPFNDPISAEGVWTSNSSFSAVHTQSTRFSESIECGATGGVDDRFDFLLISDNVISGSNRVEYVPNSYDNLGNNGSTYNESINDATNTDATPDSVLNALYYMSDHLPIIMKLAITYPDPSPMGLEEEFRRQKIKEQHQEIILKVYPNPSNSVINISIENWENRTEKTIEITDVFGRIVHSKKLDVKDFSHRVDVSSFAKGLYFVSVKDQYSVQAIKKLMVQ
ncbi:MAG: T9SS type A sorting domain-containing protein [Bacteroidia bacterium]